MKRLIVFSFVVMLAMIVSFASGSKRLDKEPALQTSIVDALGRQNPDFGNTPLYFIPNKGQVHQKAKFYAKTSRYTLWMTKKGLIFDSTRKIGEQGKIGRDVSRFVFLDANQNPEMVPLDITLHIVNYIKGSDPSKWHTDLQTSKAVMYKNIYKNIDLKVYGIEKQIEYDWIVKPGGDPENIRFAYNNIKGTRIDEKGNLRIQTEFGELSHKCPISYQVMKGEKVAVAVDFRKINGNTYGFRVDDYDKNHELVIDPVVLAYSTYLGGGGDEHAFGLAVDSSGRAYVTGDTASTDFPTDDAYQNTSGGGNIDVFVTKFSASGTSLVYSTYLGGSGSDAGEAIQVDGSGKAYVTGFAGSTDFPTQGAYQNAHGGGDKDVFVTVLSASGSSLSYSTYLGGSGDEEGFALALDSSKNIYITGRTASTDFPMQNAYDDTFTPSVANEYDAFVTKIDSSGSSLSYSTYLGGSKKETGYGIAVNGSNAFVAGRTTSTNFPLLNEYQSAHGGGDYDAFITKFSSAGNNLIYSTYLGGSDTDSAYGITVDSSGSAYVAGDTRSTDLPTQNAYQDTHGGGDKDAFAAKLSSAGTSLEYSTYLGGIETEGATHVAVDSSGNAYITGATRSSNFPIKRGYQDTFSGDFDAFISMLSADGSKLSFSTFLGGGDFDSSRGIVVDDSGNIYVAGYTRSSDFPNEDAYQDTLNGSLDAFVSKISTFQLGTLCGAVDNCNLTWTTGGSADWFETTDFSYYDDDAAQSGDIGNSQSNYLQTTVTGPGLVSFWWKVSSEDYWDYLRFYIDNVEQTAISGSSDWAQLAYTITEGTHTLKWEYTKDGSVSRDFDCGWVDKVEFSAQPEIGLSRTQLGFGAAPGTATGDQTFAISNNSASTLNWSAAPDQSWLSCTPTSGTNTGVVTVSVDTTGLGAGTYSGSISVSDPNAVNSPQAVSVTLEVYGAGNSSVPFGEYATPTDNSTISSSVPFTGWVLDDVGVDSVKLYRHEGNSLVYIGDAVFVEGARPDVEQAYPNYPYNYKAGWGYMMLTNFLPNGGNGTFTIEAIATDLEGQQASLGTKTVTVDNANAELPFGAIDTPTQGGPASGSNYRNQGWVLTPLPNTIPTNGATINVYVDGVNLGNPTYNVYRSDIASLFPGYNNSDGAHAYFDFDTTTYQDGVHTIMWIATDDAANADGIGSRYFMIQNSSGNRAQRTSAHGVGSPGAADASMEPVGLIKGYREDVEPQLIYPNQQGVLMVEMEELGRIELRFGQGKQLSGWMVVGEQLKSLPIGSTFHPDEGTFLWQAGLAFCGDYQFLFMERDAFGNMTKWNVFVRVASKF
jgi:hypothetical protein